MTAAELREKRCAIIHHALERYAESTLNISDVLDELALLDEQSKLPRPPFYAFVDQHDSQWRLFQASEGNESQQRAALDILIGSFVKYAQSLEGTK